MQGIGAEALSAYCASLGMPDAIGDIDAYGTALASLTNAESALTEASTRLSSAVGDKDKAQDAYDKSVTEYTAAKAAVDAFGKLTYTCDKESYAWTRGSGEGLTVSVLADISTFEGIMMDGISIPKEAYTVRAGSTLITLSEGYLNSLAEGTHTLTADFTYGSAKTEITVSEKTDESGTAGDDTGTPDDVTPDTENPDTEKPDTENPDTVNPDTDKPDTENPDTVKPDKETPDTEDSRPANTTDSQTGDPVSNVSTENQPQQAQSPSNGTASSPSASTGTMESKGMSNASTKSAVSPNTGDTQTAGIWASMMLIAGIFLAFMAPKHRKTKKNG